MNLSRNLVLVFSVLFYSLLSLGAVQADQIFYSVKGEKQGLFKSESTQRGREGTAPVRVFQYAIVSPRDPASGQATGKRQHKPIVITKLWGASSPQLYQAMVNNEVLAEVNIDFYEPSFRGDGRIVLGHSIKLSNANITEISYNTEDAGSNGLRQLETVSFTFQKIEYLDGSRKVIVADDGNISIN
jgi:type VI secretion system secreted protein Hcp